MEAKIDAKKEMDRLQKKIDLYTKEFPEIIPADQLIDKLSDFARNNGVQIMTFSPAKQTEDDFVTLFSVKINISADTYEDLQSFVSEIETAPYPLLIENINSKLGAKRKGGSTNRNIRRRGISNEKTVDIIEADIVIDLVTLNES